MGWRVIPRFGFGSFGVSPHGIGIAAGVFAGAWFMARRARSREQDPDLVWSGAYFGVIGSILGARIAYVAGHFSEFESPIQWLKIWEGGISLVGGLLGAFTAVYIYTRRRNISFFRLVDLGAPWLGLGIAVGRIGDLLIGDHLGKETSGWWGWQYKGGLLISPPPCTTPVGEAVYSTIDGCIAPGTIVHQTALYDSIWSLAIFGLLLLLDKNPRKSGFMFLSWASLYAVGRIATDFARVDKHWFGLGLTGSQLTSIAALLVCLLLLLLYRGAPPMATSTELPPPAYALEEEPSSTENANMRNAGAEAEAAAEEPSEGETSTAEEPSASEGEPTAPSKPS